MNFWPTLALDKQNPRILRRIGKPSGVAGKGLRGLFDHSNLKNNPLDSGDSQQSNLLCWSEGFGEVRASRPASLIRLEVSRGVLPVLPTAKDDPKGDNREQERGMNRQDSLKA